MWWPSLPHAIASTLPLVYLSLLVPFRHSLGCPVFSSIRKPYFCGSGKLRADLPEIRTHAVEMSIQKPIQNAVQPDVCVFSIRVSCASELDVTLAHHLAQKDCVKGRLRGRFMGSPRLTHRFASLRQRRLRWANQCPRAAPAYASPDLRAACSTTLNAAARSAGAARRTHPARRDQHQARQQQRYTTTSFGGGFGWKISGVKCAYVRILRPRVLSSISAQQKAR